MNSPLGPTVALVVKFVRFEDRKLAVCRIFSGQITAGAILYVLGRKVYLAVFKKAQSLVNLFFKARKDGSEAPKATVESVWALRGRDVIPLEKATAGVICAIDAQGLVQNSTLCSEAVSEGLDVGLKQGEPLVQGIGKHGKSGRYGPVERRFKSSFGAGSKSSSKSF
ncbi:hypothetical protein OSTOST_24160 [Ostertagia ostertagi]